MANIHQLQHQLQLPGIVKVALHHFAPAQLFALIHARKAIARQIDQVKCVARTTIDFKHVQQPRFARRAAGFGQLAVAA